MTRKTQVCQAFLLAMTFLMLDPFAGAQAQFGVPGIPGPGIGGGGVTSFTPSVSNTLNRNPSPGSSSAAIFGQARQESSTQTPKYIDSNAFRSTQNTRSSGGASFSDALISQKNRRSERIGRSKSSANFGFKIPPGIQAVKNARRMASGSIAIDTETNKPASFSNSGAGLSSQP